MRPCYWLHSKLMLYNDTTSLSNSCCTIPAMLYCMSWQAHIASDIMNNKLHCDRVHCSLSFSVLLYKCTQKPISHPKSDLTVRGTRVSYCLQVLPVGLTVFRLMAHCLVGCNMTGFWCNVISERQLLFDIVRTASVWAAVFQQICSSLDDLPSGRP